jgi:hypothetical protein
LEFISYHEIMEQKLKSNKSLLILIAILALLGGYVYFFEKGPLLESSGSGTPFIENLDPQKMVEVTIWNGDTSQLLIDCQKSKDSTWKIASPIPDQGDKVEIDGFFMDLKTLKAARVLKDNLASMAEYGLDHPQLIISIKSDSETRFMVGTTAPGNDTYYVKKDNDPAIYLINSSQVGRWFGSDYKFRNKALADFSVDNIREVDYQRGKGKYTFVKSQEQWHSTQPGNYEINRYKLEDALWKITSGQVMRFEINSTLSLADYGLAQPAEVIRLKTNDNKNWELQVSTKGPQPALLYAKSNTKPYIFAIESTLLVPLHFKDISEIRNKNIFSFMMDDIQSIHCELPYKFELNKKGDDWFIQPSSIKVEYNTLQDMLTEITNLQAGRILDESVSSSKKYGLDKPGYLITLADSHRKKYTLAIKESHAEIYAKSDSQPYLFTLTPEAYQQIRMNIEKIRQQAGIK